MKRIALIAISVLFFVSCATTYQDSGYTGGYSETLLDENIVKIQFKGNKYTSAERAADYAMLRAAEFTLERGYSYFVILESNEWIKTTTQTTGGGTTQKSVYSFEKQAYETVSVQNSPKTTTTNKIICLILRPIMITFSPLF